MMLRVGLSRRARTLTLGLLVGSFSALVLWPIVDLVTAKPTVMVHQVALIGIFRLLLFFCWFLTFGYWFFRSLPRVDPGYQSATRDKRNLPRVAILIPIRDEPELVIRRMLEHIKGVDYPSFTIVVVDNSITPQGSQILAIAARLHIPDLTVVRKADTIGFKAGALNHGLTALRDEEKHVLVLDVDHAPFPNILSVLVPILEANPRLAFVQAPQQYAREPQSIAAVAFAYKQRIFYEHVCPGLSTAGCLFLSGSNVLVRCAALKEVGGFDESSLTEDLRTSLRLNALGWKGVFLPRTLAIGYAPTSLGAYHRQLRRWAIGTYQNWGAALRTLLASPDALKPEQWLFYLGWNGLFYLQGMASYLLLAVSAVLFWAIPAPRFWPIDIVPLAMLLVTLIATSIHERRHAGTPWPVIGASKLVFFGDFAIMAKGFVDLWLRRELVFEVTPKCATVAVRVDRSFYLINLLTATTALAMLVIALKWRGTSWPELLWTALFLGQAAGGVLIAILTRPRGSCNALA